MSFTVSGLDADTTYLVPLTGAQVEEVRRALIGDHTLRAVVLQQEGRTLHPLVERRMQAFQADLERILDALPVGEVRL